MGGGGVFLHSNNRVNTHSGTEFYTNSKLEWLQSLIVLI